MPSKIKNSKIISTSSHIMMDYEKENKALKLIKQILPQKCSNKMKMHRVNKEWNPH